MKLNQDCIRDLLLYLEDNLTLTNNISINDLKLNNYSSDEILYTADKLFEAQFIDCYRRIYNTNDLRINVKSITYQGHQFLDSIRDNNIWGETKTKLSKFASVSLPIVQELASSIIKVNLGLS